MCWWGIKSAADNALWPFLSKHTRTMTCIVNPLISTNSIRFPTPFRIQRERIESEVVSQDRDEEKQKPHE